MADEARGPELVSAAGAADVVVYPAAQGAGRPVHWASKEIESPILWRFVPACGTPIGRIAPLVYVRPELAAARTWCPHCLSWRQSLHAALS